MDSIVDAFIPLINSIEIEIENVDDLVSGMGDEFQDSESRAQPEIVAISPPHWLERLSEKWNYPNPPEDDESGEKNATATHGKRFGKIRCAVSIGRQWCLRVALVTFTRIVRLMKLGQRRKISSRMHALLKMSRTRRMVVLLARLLAPKSEIIGHLRKRLMTGELAAQLGDVQGT